MRPAKINWIIFTIALMFSVNLLSQDLTEANSIHQFKLIDVDGNEFDFSCLEGQKILLVNTASKCMFAPQLKKLQELYEKYKNQGFVVVAFPSSDFYNRELKTNKEIAKKYREKHHITFPIISKTKIKGDSIHALFDFLGNKSLNGKFDAPPKWNFHKYLIDNQGYIYKSISPKTGPFNEEIVNWIEEDL